MAFELLKVKDKQPPEIQQKIDSASSLLLEVSNINYPERLPNLPGALHEYVRPAHDFEYYKPRYREILHQLYKHFLNDAIHRYNSAKRELSQRPNSVEALKMKEDGLASYKLCWKLLEASLILRKGGYDLDIGRIETSQRKEIEIGINNLLAKYFPNKLY